LTFVQSHNTSAETFAISADGMNLYVTRGPDKLQVYTRNPMTGVLTLLEEQENGVGGVDGIRRAKGVAVTPDGACVYTSTDFDDKVGAFSRNGGTGALTFVGVKEEGVGGVTGLLMPKGVAVSADSLDVYVAGQIHVSGPDDATVVAFRRTPPSCALAYVETEVGDADGLGSVDASDGIIASGDGKNVYLTGRVTIENVVRGR
jgi:6-phosphogluconolactonase (cycloisomerase 2 family)